VCGLMDYSIVATLGPSSADATVWTALLSAGATAFRLNTSHFALPQLQEWLERLDSFLSALEPRPPLILDLQGSKWRLGELPACELVAGQPLTLAYGQATKRPDVLPVPHLDFFQAAPLSNGEIILNDARVMLRVEAYAADSLRATVVQGGALSSRKGITYTGRHFSMAHDRREALTDQDHVIREQTQGMVGIEYALSYVRDAAEMARYRACIGRAYLIAKVERRLAMEEAVPMAGIADELWLCRGDLGAEMGLREMAKAAYRFSAELSALPAPVLLAGQVLEHLTAHATPTRAEVCGLYAALQQGYAGVVLSDETAVGCDPAASCRWAAMFRGM
jgi:pyruvate kinase